ncbi:thermonuclease family protein [Amaricoccus macauensis]|uniref:thermonuclease family protein n=1 Tax=Amaricoccus macauensis TaxID=57001 RepID=UPI003C7CD60B
MTRIFRRQMRLAALLLCATLAAPLAIPHSAHAEITGTPEALDADTFDIGMVRIRLHGVDAPELSQTCTHEGGGTWPCGARALERFRELAGQGRVVCTGRERDPYGRIIATCEAAGVDIGRALVSEGLAWAYREYSDDYAPEEARARAAGLGIWQAETQTAWAFRADRWQRAAASAPRTGCPIKGNINGKGERIYHTPWSKYYSRTKINEANGEAWFCDEAEAEAAGWRPAANR